jgi:hypothetical protein
MRAFASAWPDYSDNQPTSAIVQQPAAQLPWFHICTIMDKLKQPESRLWYMHKATELARQTLKYPYIFDFLSLAENAKYVNSLFYAGLLIFVYSYLRW